MKGELKGTNLFHSRQGKVFTLLLFFIYLAAALTALGLIISGITSKIPEQELGEYQSAVMAASSCANQRLVYLRTSAVVALNKALDLLYQESETFFTTIEGDTVTTQTCGGYAYPLWNIKGKECLLGTNATQRILAALQPKTLEYLSQMTNAYPEGAFNVQYELVTERRDDVFKVFFRGQPLTEQLLTGFADERRSPGQAAAVTRAYTTAGAIKPSNGLLWPSSSTNLVTSCFGPRDLSYSAGKNHLGIDIAPKTTVRAAAAGIVLNDPSTSTLGAVWIQHSPGLSTRYLHLDPDSITVKRGDAVAAGQELGIATHTGCWKTPGVPCGDHLHFEVLVKSVPGTGAVVYSSANTPGWLAVNPVCFFSEETLGELSLTQTGQPCGEGDWKHKWCSEYGFTDSGIKETSTLTEGISTIATPAPSSEPTSSSPPSHSGQANQEATSSSNRSSYSSAGTITFSYNAAGLTSSQAAKLAATKANMEKYGWAPFVVEASSQYGVPIPVILAFITQESLGDPGAISQTGCLGIMQICYGTGLGLPGLGPGTMTVCGCSKKGESTCKCTVENDRRQRPEIAIKAGTSLIKSNMDRYAGYREQLRLAAIAYNAGPDVVGKGLRGVGGDPSWEEIVSYWEKHPETVSRQKLEQEVKVYGPNIYAFANAWNAGAAAGSVAPIDRAYTESIERVKEEYGDVVLLGTYSYDPSFTVELPDKVKPFADLLSAATKLVDDCANAEMPGTCLVERGAKQTPSFSTRCEEDAETQYFIDLYHALRDCGENNQMSCACALPGAPPATVHSYIFSFDVLERRATLTKDGQPVPLSFDETAPRFLQVATESGEGIIPSLLNITLDKKGILLNYQANDGLASSFSSFTLEKGRDPGRVVFRRAGSGVASCAPVKTHYSFCAEPLQGTNVKFALTVKDRTDPEPVVVHSFDDVSGTVSFTPSPSQDVAFYNIYLFDPNFVGPLPPKQLQLQTTGTRFDASCFRGKGVEIRSVDLAGNEGDGATLEIPGPMSTDGSCSWPSMVDEGTVKTPS